ncbi:Phage phiEco32-like COOH.NH2 ligase-type 2 [Paenibacillus algorifonticola]|uniref:Phage phiEco32-like COOH.NH2 ligase-type 2 n=1 Tax=Paenibacillus algorifonticola TaxID=684063 RepID=A0A1I2BV30_9BACL|nr:hypothetical protein [Paenibacillus algorifonticola]SFE59969.1 Phage phiEco32-like COOH.NH2 ligase-type 2 [Paenibacillus algorifonticola]
MAAVWLWNSSTGRLELAGKETAAAGSASNASLLEEVRAGDAVIVSGCVSEKKAAYESRQGQKGHQSGSGQEQGVWEQQGGDKKQGLPALPSGSWLLNEGEIGFAAMSAADQQQRLRRAGLLRRQELGDSDRLYKVAIAHLEPIELQRLDRWGRPAAGQPLLRAEPSGHAAAPWPRDAALRRVIRAAVAALYALGLDMGEAEVVLGEGGRAAVRAAGVLRDAKLRAVGLARMAAWYEAAAAPALGTAPKLLLGADPEFALVRPDGRIVPASRFFGDGAQGAAGSDAMLIGRRIVYPVAELRPEPAESPAALAAHLRRLLLRAAERISDPSVCWVAGAMPVPGLPLGGHIHLSGTPLSSRLLRLLDSYAAFPLALVEDPAGRSRRPRYGALGEYRQQPHGGFEYRTLPSWLISPAAAKASLALALLCARETRALTDIPALDERYVEAFYSGDRAELAGCLNPLAAAMAATPSYAALAADIEPLLDAARRGITWDERADIRHKWRIPMPAPASNRSSNKKTT